MKVGDLVQIIHNERHGMFVVLNSEDFSDRWAKILSLRDGKTYCEMTRSLEVISESRR